MSIHNGMILITPSSVVKTGASSTATINASGSVTFLLCETLSLNNVFSSEFDNYMIDIQTVASEDSKSIYYKMRASENDNSGNNYVSQELFASSTSISAGRYSAASFGRFMAIGSTTYDRNGITGYIFGPFLSQPTALRTIGTIGYNVSNPRNLNDYTSTHSQSTSYDGISLIMSAGTFTGLLKVYGLRQ